MKKNKRLLTFMLTSTLLPVMLSPIAAKCKEPKKPTPNPETPSEPEETEKDKKIKEINKWLDEEVNGNLSIIEGKEKEFYKAINDGNDFWYDRNTGKVITTKKGERPDWKNNKNYLLEFKGITRPENYQVVNAKEPTWDNGAKLSSKLDYEIDKENNIIFSYKTAIYQGKNQEHIISTKNGSSNLGKKIDEDTVNKIEEMNKKAKEETTFDYPNKENTYLEDADIEKITKNIPDGYELVQYKAVKNKDKEYYDITIIFKLKIKGTNITMLKNASYVIKGWKKTKEILDFEEEARNKINDEINKTKVSILNEKAYQHIINHKTINNFDNKPNFTTKGFDKDKYNVELKDVKVEDNLGKKIVKLTVKMYVKSNKDIFVEKEILVENEYANGKNFHNLSEEEIKNYIENVVNKTILHPKFSKDKTYIEKLNNGKITDKSFWIDNIDHNLNYNFGSISKEGDDYYVELTASIANWPNSPFVSKKTKIDLSKLGINILNEIRRKKGQDPLPDEFAPSSTIDEEIEPDLSLDKFKDTPEDNYESKKAPQLNKFLKNIEYLYAWDQEQYDILKNNPDKKLVQLYRINKQNYTKKGNMYLFNAYKVMTEEQTVYVFSKPEFKDNKLTVKITAIPLQDYNAGAIDIEKIASKRVEVRNDKFGKDLYEQWHKSLKLNEEIKKLNLSYDFKDKEKLASKDINDWDFEKIKEHLIINNLTNNYKIWKINKPKNQKAKSLTLYVYYKKDDFESIISFKIVINGFLS